jgi:beta-mannosidase
LLARSNVDLVFDGLDAAAQVYVNGAQVLSADNSFRVWRVPVKSASARRQEPAARGLSIAHQGRAGGGRQRSFPGIRRPKTDKTYIRKPAYEYGWDWGPRFVTSGIWKPVRLEAWDKVRIADFAIRQRDVSKEVAHLDAEVEVEAASAGPAKVSVQYSDDGKPVTLTRKRSASCRTQRDRSAHRDSKPKLWYPAGYGEQPLYEFTAQVGT